MGEIVPFEGLSKAQPLAAMPLPVAAMPPPRPQVSPVRARHARRRTRLPAWSPLLVLFALAAGGYFVLEGSASGGVETSGTVHLSRGIVGFARVIDGDTIWIGNVPVRLFGIDAPEFSQSCKNAAGVAYSCGAAASRALNDMVRGKQVACDRRDTDQYGRTVAVCIAQGKDLNAALVEAGLAVAYRQFSSDYVPNESRAKQAHRGLWAGSFEMPWNYRHKGGSQ